MAIYRLLEPVTLEGQGKSWPTGTEIEVVDNLPSYLEGKVELVKRKYKKSKKSNESKSDGD